MAWNGMDMMGEKRRRFPKGVPGFHLSFPACGDDDQAFSFCILDDGEL